MAMIVMGGAISAAFAYAARRTLLTLVGLAMYFFGIPLAMLIDYFMRPLSE